MKFPARLALAFALLLASALPASAGWPFARHQARGVRFLRGVEVRQTVVYRSTVAAPAPACPTPAGYQAYPTPQAPAKVMPTPQVIVPAQAMSAAMTESRPAADDAATFLALLNQARAQAGRPALAWDATLAAYAATNAATHAPGSSGGASQVWAGTQSYRHAFAMWANSPAHWTILINARTSVGGSYSATGITVNAR